MPDPTTQPISDEGGWPELPYEQWSPTRAALHLFSQVVGKIRMRCGPWVNHSWGVTLYVNGRGFGTGLVPYGNRGFQIDFDFIGSQVSLVATDGGHEEIELRPMSVDTFYEAIIAAMDRLGMPVSISTMPNEIEGAIPFDQDRAERAYDAEHARLLWLALVQAQRVLANFRAGFQGKASPVHLFWGGFDLAVTRFSGRRAPDHPGGMPHFPLDIAREAYTHEVTSAGLWLGGDTAPQPLFYSYSYPTPEGFGEAKVRPEQAFWYPDLGEFVLPYDAVRQSPDPDQTLMSFLEDSHAAAADLANWHRGELERPPGFGAEWWRNRDPAGR
jgi:hypothetical protein